MTDSTSPNPNRRALAPVSTTSTSVELPVPSALVLEIDWLGRLLIGDAPTIEKRYDSHPHFLKIHEISALVEAALKHDAETFALTRAEHDGSAEPGSTRRYAPISPLVLIALQTGFRFGELASLRWASISLAENEILLSHSETKTRQARRIDLTPTPMLAALLRVMETAHKGEYCLGGVAPLRRDMAEAARKRLIQKYGAPKFTWHDLRRTCGTYLTCAPAIYGGASAYLSAKRPRRRLPPRPTPHRSPPCRTTPAQILSPEPRTTPRRPLR
ncbi:MAG: tyrosine-type recombinase/integrase, partial [Planctomycetes bacterium]|nr:tyrosine-type recombinase/integrase [Planctomycetota bacterium]